MHHQLNSFLQNFDIVSAKGDQYQARCPAHEDDNPSLAIKVEEDKILLYCHAGCSTEAILSKVGLRTKDLFLNSDVKHTSHIDPIQYDYYDEQGSLVHSTIKYYRNDKKQFRQCSYQNGVRINSLRGTRKVIYNLLSVVQSIISGWPIYIVEGEKDAETLIKRGRCATTSPMGAGKWKDEYSDSLLGADAIIIPDNDKPGYEHAMMVADSLEGKAKSIKVVELPDLKEGEDITDWFEKGHTIDEFDSLVLKCKTRDKSNSKVDNEKYIWLSELGNAEEFAQAYENLIAFNHSRKDWWIFEEGFWIKDQKRIIDELAKEFISKLIAPIKNNNDFKRKCTALSRRIALRAMIDLASSIPKLAKVEADFDKDPYLFALKNGKVNLHDCSFSQIEPTDYLTKRADFNYDEKATCDNWLAFLDVIFDSNRELIDFIQVLVGYSLCGTVSEEIYTFCYGSGKNGKSIFFNVLEKLLGDYAQKVPTEALVQRQSDSVSNDLARLKGVRFGIAAEWPENRKINEAKIKDLTGGDKITARFLYGEFFEFLPSLTLWMYGNHKPIINGTDMGIWRRIMLIPFTVIIPDEIRKPRNILVAELESELPGIFNWAICGWKRYQTEGLMIPDIVKAANTDFREDSNSLLEFINQKCDIGEKNYDKGTELYDAYTKWSSEARETPQSCKQFYKHLQDLGYRSYKTSQGRYKAFNGISVRSEDSDEIFNTL